MRAFKSGFTRYFQIMAAVKTQAFISEVHAKETALILHLSLPVPIKIFISIDLLIHFSMYLFKQISVYSCVINYTNKMFF